MFYLYLILFYVFLAFTVHAKVLDFNAAKQERMRLLEASSVTEVRDITFTNCTSVYKSAEWMRGLELDFLLTFRQESQTLIYQLQDSISALGIDEVGVTQLQFLLNVTQEQVSDIVDNNVQLLQEFMYMCKLICQNLDTMTSKDLVSTAADIKLRVNQIKIKIIVAQKDISDMFLEFYEFVQAMMEAANINKELHELVVEVRNMFEGMYKNMYRHKSRLTGARRDLVTKKIALINRLTDLTYKTEITSAP